MREILRHRPVTVDEILVSARPGKRRSEIEALARRQGLAVKEVSNEDLGGSTRVHNGFAARLHAEMTQPGRGGDPELLVLVEDVQDPRNLGALVRVCEGAGVGRLLIRDRGSAPLSATVSKTSAGATEWLPIERVVNSSRTIQDLKRDGFWVYGADPEGQPPWEIDLKGKVVLCLGGEDKGLRRRTRETCDALIGLPMRGRVDSLNISTAASALLYEAVRQRGEGNSSEGLQPGDDTG